MIQGSDFIELNLSSFKTDKVTDMSNIFSNCKNLSKIDLSSLYKKSEEHDSYV